MKYSISIFVFCLLMLSACLPEQPVITPQIPPATNSGVSEAFKRLATQTQSAALTATAEFLQAEPTLDGATALTPSPLPSLPPKLNQAGPFQQVSRQEAPIIGKVINLQTLPDGSLLLLSESGYGKFKDDEWTAYFVGETGYLVGIDPVGRGWAVTYDGSYISRWESRNEDIEIWIAYSENEGWSPPDSRSGNPVAPGLFTDGNGNIWIAIPQDVRRFDGNRWQVFDAQALGMTPPEDDSNANYTIYPLPGSDEVYVGRCNWSSAGMAGGGGVRKYDGSDWTIPGAALETGCVTAITQDTSGNLWVASDDSLYLYESTRRTFEQVALPESPPQTWIGYTTALTPAPDGSLWAQFTLCEDIACFGKTALYHLRDGLWQMVGEPSMSGGQKLLFDAAGNTWVLSAGGISQIVDNSLQTIPGLTVLAATTDLYGKLWLVAQSTGPPTLWNQP
jgi:hypothetical protein